MGIRLNQFMGCCADKVINNKKSTLKREVLYFAGLEQISFEISLNLKMFKLGEELTLCFSLFLLMCIHEGGKEQTF